MKLLWTFGIVRHMFTDAKVVQIPLSSLGDANPILPTSLAQEHDGIDELPIMERHPALPILNIVDSQYFVNASFGSPSQQFRLSVGTKSVRTWLNSVSCTSSRCEKWGKRKYNSSSSSTYVRDGRAFSDRTREWGEVEGYTSMDNVDLAGNIVEGQVFGEVNKATSDYGYAWFDGMLGLGLPDRKQTSIVHSLLDHHYIDQPVFSLYFVRGNATTESELLLGSIDEDRFTSPLHELQVSSNATQWQIQLDTLEFEGDVLKPDGMLPVIFDTMESSILLPSNIMAYLAAKLPPSGQELCNKLNDLPDLKFTLGGQTFELQPIDYIWQYEDYCLPLFFPSDEGEGDAPEIIVGTAFLTRWYSVFDLSKRTISLGRAKTRSS